MSQLRVVPSALYVVPSTVGALPTRERSRRASTPRVTHPPSLAPQEVATRPSSRTSTVFAFLGFVLGFAVALAGIEWMHRASLTAMRDSAMLRDPGRP